MPKQIWPVSAKRIVSRA